MLKNIFEGIPQSDSYDPAEYGLPEPVVPVVYRRDDEAPISEALLSAYEGFIEPSVEFQIPLVSNQLVVSLLEEVSLLKQVGYDPSNPPALQDLIPAIEHRLNEATSEAEFYSLARKYDSWLYFLYGVKMGV